jgi:hypothetical protein
MRRTIRIVFGSAAAIGAAASYFLWSPSPAAAAPGPDLYIHVLGQAACTTNTSPPPRVGDALCDIEQGRQFTVQGVVGSLEGLRDLNENGTVGYAGFQMRIVYSEGLISVDRPGETELGPPGAPYWPDCSIRAEFNTPAFRLPSCLVQGKEESTHVGPLAEEDFLCADPGRQALTLPGLYSYLHNEFHGTAADDDGDEVLTIDCVAPPDEASGPDPAAPNPSLLDPTPAAGDDLPVAGGGPSGGAGPPIAYAVAAAAMACVAMAGSLVLATRRRQE